MSESCTLYLFDEFETNVHKKLIDLEDDTFKFVLSNTAYNLAWTQLSQVTQIASGNGYTTGGATVSVSSLSQTSGTMSWVLGSDVVWTASGGPMASARYMYLYDDTSTNDLLVGVMDYGSSEAVADGLTWTISSSGVTVLTVERYAVE